ncbi:hypothetical protein SUGI_0370380 [Cryptomeria japonica]|nr:hypothetical protein SUGI_0370380 [Cryptomeria japonica]
MAMLLRFLNATGQPFKSIRSNISSFLVDQRGWSFQFFLKRIHKIENGGSRLLLANRGFFFGYLNGMFYHTGCPEGVVPNYYQSHYVPHLVKITTVTSQLCVADQFVCLEAKACQYSKVVTWFIRAELLRKLFSLALEVIFFQCAVRTSELHETGLDRQKTGETGRMLSLCFGLLTNLTRFDLMQRQLKEAGKCY